MNNFLPSSFSRQETSYRECGRDLMTLRFLSIMTWKLMDHVTHRTWKGKKKEKRWDSSTRGRKRDIELNESVSQSFSTCGFPLESKTFPASHSLAVSSHRKPSVIWNRNRLFTSSMCEAAQLHRGNRWECSRSKGRVGSHHQVTSPALNREHFPLYGINNHAYWPGLSLVEWKKVRYAA